ncbi:MAG TPA: 50S ribosomal protein L4 [Candidatus Thermoplasmatota archaeon]|nr:50S ribosomal protein L4 [Candidatus Thermoplasmatota archaeon]
MAVKVKVYGVDGAAKGEQTLSAKFEQPLRPDLIRKAVSVARANRRQPYGSDPEAGRKHSTESWGPGSGVSRIPRLRAGRRAAGVPPVVGGPRAHPPKAEKAWTEKINRKEARRALASALSATARKEIVAARGHKFEDKVTLPLVVEDAFEAIDKTSELLAAFEKLGLAPDLVRAREGTQQRPGIGKLRGRRYKVPRSLLLVVSPGAPVARAAENLPGVDVVSPLRVDTEAVAPGGDAGRLLVISKKALSALEGRP